MGYVSERTDRQPMKQGMASAAFELKGLEVPLRYKSELLALDTAYSAAMRIEIDELIKIVHKQSFGPLITIGSGGSFSSATFGAAIHERVTQELARAVTPLEFLDASDINASVMCFSASGRNRDITYALTSAARRECGPVSAFVMDRRTPLHAVARKYTYCQIAECCDASFRDGFLAVATLLATSIVMTRAYAAISNEHHGLPTNLSDLERETLRGERYTDIPEKAKTALLHETASLLVSPLFKATAIDLESRFVEAALGNIHVADLRNFGHGRHHWIAKRGNNTGIVVLASDRNRSLANRTTRLLPPTSDVCRIDLHGNIAAQAISALVVGLYISCGAGEIRGIDPGKPGVPQFGRKLYHLSPGRRPTSELELDKRAAIRRKCYRDRSIDHQSALQAGYVEAVGRLATTSFGAIVFDYDGTLCGEEDRFRSMPKNVAEGLEKLNEAGVAIGIATGRGSSAGKAMRESLPSQLWSRIVIGYYNGAVITSLEDDRDELVQDDAPERLIHALQRDEILGGAEIRSNALQVSLRLEYSDSLMDMYERTHIVLSDQQIEAKVHASGHSIDVLLGRESKCSVVDHIKIHKRANGILRVGDKGRWPGNDADLLKDKFGLSVDEVSEDPDTCWNMAPAGVRGVQATLHYLNRLERHGDGVKLVLPAYEGLSFNEA